MNKKIAYGGMLLAVNVILLFLINIIPNNTIFLMAIASLIISVVVMEWGLKTAFMYYLGSILLGFIVMANKVHWIVYVCTFAIYGIIKFLIEKNRPIVIEYTFKLIYANMVALALYFMLRTVVYLPMNIFIILTYEVAFLIYDYTYSMFIDYYNQNLKKRLFKE